MAVTALWVLAVLALLAAGTAQQTRYAVKAEGLRQATVQARALALSGVSCGWRLLDGLAPFQALSQPWSVDAGPWRRVELASGHFSLGCEPASADSGRCFLLVDEERKINLNTAPAAVLERLPGLESGQVAALLDWRDEDGAVGPGGAEDGYYAGMGRACKDGPLESIEELALVRGMGPETVRRLAPWVTVFGEGRVNINTAPVEVLEALGGDRGLALKIQRFRQGADGIDGTADDRVFESLEKVRVDLAEREDIGLEEAVVLDRILRSGDVRSRHFRLVSRGYAADGAVHRIEAVGRYRDDGPLEVVSWREY